MTEAPTTTARHRRVGFRTRVLGLCAVLLISAASLGLVLQRTVLLGRLDREVASSLAQERLEMEQFAVGRNPESGEPFGGDVVAIFDTFLARNIAGEGEVYLTFVGEVPYKSTAAPLGVRLDADDALVARWTALTAGESGRIDSDAGPVDYLAVPLRFGAQTQGVFVVANFVQNERDEIDDGIRVEAIISAIVLLLALGAAWLLAGRLLRPIRQLTDTARSIGENDLSARIPVDTNDEIAELAETFNDMLDRLDDAFASQRAFIDDAGHELRTPITIVRGHLEVMGDDPDDRRETVALVTDELDRMARIVNDLLVLAKAEQPDFIHPVAVEMSDFTTELLMKSRVLGQRSWQLDACASGLIVLDPDRITQAVLNLARNAVEHTVAGAEIGIGSAVRADGVHFWVRDTGPGIEAAERDEIFDRFRRGRVKPRSSDGAGLGLAIVRAVADGHGARVDVGDAPGGGAEFTIVLPGPPASAADDHDAGRPLPAFAHPITDEHEVTT